MLESNESIVLLAGCRARGLSATVDFGAAYLSLKLTLWPKLDGGSLYNDLDETLYSRWNKGAQKY